MNLAEQLGQGVAELKLAVPAETQAKLLEYVALIAKWNRVHNLTAIRSESKMVSDHLLDCLAVATHLVPGSVLDVGSGAGLPGIVLALLWPRAQVTLLDSNHKKAAFLNQVVIELKLGNATVVCERVETWRGPAAYDLVISRALSDLPEFVQLAGRHCRGGGLLVAMKGVHPHEELTQIPPAFRLQAVVPLKVPGLRAARHLVVLARVS
jgi:16S rRNA (guanine527-N7)-methyltransferase